MISLRLKTILCSCFLLCLLKNPAAAQTFDAKVHVILIAHGSEKVGDEDSKKLAAEALRLIDARIKQFEQNNPGGKYVLWLENATVDLAPTSYKEILPLCNMLADRYGLSPEEVVLAVFDTPQNQKMQELTRIAMECMRTDYEPLAEADAKKIDAIRQMLSETTVASTRKGQFSSSSVYTQAILDWAFEKRISGVNIEFDGERLSFESWWDEIQTTFWDNLYSGEIKNGTGQILPFVWMRFYYQNRNFRQRDQDLSQMIQKRIAEDPVARHIVIRGTLHHYLADDLRESGVPVSSSKFLMGASDKPGPEFSADLDQVKKGFVSDSDRVFLVREIIKSIVEICEKQIAGGLTVDTHLDLDQFFARLPDSYVMDWDNQIGQFPMRDSDRARATYEWYVKARSQIDSGLGQ